MTQAILKLARRCADKGLDYRAAKALFNALYLAELAMTTGNNRAAMGRRAGMGRREIYRIEDNETQAKPKFESFRNDS